MSLINPAHRQTKTKIGRLVQDIKDRDETIHDIESVSKSQAKEIIRLNAVVEQLKQDIINLRMPATTHYKVSGGGE